MTKTKSPVQFTKRARLTKQKELLICKRKREFPDSTCNDLAKWAYQNLSLAKIPTKPVISRVLKSEIKLLCLSPECLQRKKAYSPHQLLLDQSVIEFMVFCEFKNIALSGELIMARAKMLAIKLKITPCSWPKFGRSWLRHLEVRYGIR